MAVRPRTALNRTRPVAYGNGAEAPSRSGTAPALGRDTYDELKSRLHQSLVNRLDVAVLVSLDRSILHDQIGRVTETLLAEEDIYLAPDIRERLIAEIQDEMLGLGPLEQYMNRSEVSDILVDGF